MRTGRPPIHLAVLAVLFVAACSGSPTSGPSATDLGGAMDLGSGPSSDGTPRPSDSATQPDPGPIPNGCPAPDGFPFIPIPRSTAFSFEPEKLDVPVGHWACAGLVDMDGDGALDGVLASYAELRILRHEAKGWSPLAIQSLILGPPNPDLHLGCGAADLNGDGHTDVVIADPSGGWVFLNQTDGGLLPLPLPSFPTPAPPYGFPATSSIAILDADRDGNLDLFVGRTVINGQFEFAVDECRVYPDGDFVWGTEGKEYLGYPDLLLLGAGDGTFSVAESRIPSTSRMTLAAGAADLDGDGDQDLIVVNDGASNDVLVNDGLGFFTDATWAFGFEHYNHGMGLDLGDLNGDGVRDILFTDVGIPLVLLGRERGFEKASASIGIEPISLWAWGVRVVDVDNDGLLDALISSEIVADSEWELGCSNCIMQALPQAEILLYRQTAAAGLDAARAVDLPRNWNAEGAKPAKEERGGSRNMAMGDVNGDGAVDGIVLRYGKGSTLSREPWLLWGKITDPKGWLDVEAPIGAWVEVCVGTRCQRREIRVSRSSGGTLHQPREHFGLGDASSASVRVEWPHGRWNTLGDIPSGTLVSYPPSKPSQP